MPVGYPKDQSKKQKRNGGGLASLTPQQRQTIFRKRGKIAKDRRDGFPVSVQKDRDPSSYQRANEEWARLMFNSKMKSAKK